MDLGKIWQRSSLSISRSYLFIEERVIVRCKSIRPERLCGRETMDRGEMIAFVL